MSVPKLKLVVSKPGPFAGVDFEKYQSRIDEAYNNKEYSL